ncbi:hypothetical protein R6Q57_019215 [Mikania cordata]
MLLKFLWSWNQNDDRIVAGEKSSVLQIIHAGGTVERYYMAFPAACIMDKYPNFVLARPEIFRRPWDSIVRPEEILVPGQKYFVVPIPTVKKLHRRLRKPIVEMPNRHDHDADCSKSLLIGEPNTVNRRLRLYDRRLKNNLRFTPSLSVIYETQGLDD